MRTKYIIPVEHYTEEKPPIFISSLFLSIVRVYDVICQKEGNNDDLSDRFKLLTIEKK